LIETSSAYIKAAAGFILPFYFSSNEVMIIATLISIILKKKTL